MENAMNGKGNRPLRVAVYCRLASEDQISQNALIQEYTSLVRSHENWTLMSIYMDIGVPASPLSKRIQLNRLLADCRKGGIDKILVKSISRLAKDMRTCQEILRELTSLGVTVYFEQEGIDTEHDSLCISLTHIDAMVTAAAQGMAEAENDEADTDGELEYSYYAEQKYMYAGYIEARILTAQEAAALGYEDGYMRHHEDHKVYVDGFDSEDAARSHLEELVNCRIVK